MSKLPQLKEKLGRWRSRVGRRGGFALLIVVVTVSIMGAIVGEFSYNARIEIEGAMNARDQLRAEYLARSGINLARLIIKVQQVALDRNRQYIGDMQLADFAPYLIGAFGGSKDEREGLGSLLGLDTANIKGLGVGKDASFDVVIGSEDGKINVNCGAGLNPSFTGGTTTTTTGQPSSSTTSSTSTAVPIASPQQALYALLTALFFPTRYNRLFDNPDSEGQYSTRDEVARAILDWGDIDEQRYEPTGAGGNVENYRYDSLRDPYKAHNNYFDTIDELQLVKGVGDDFWGSFGEMLTVYGGCKININAIKAEHWPISAALIRTAASNPQDPALYDEVQVAALAQQISSVGQLLGGIQSTSQFSDMSKNAGLPIGSVGTSGAQGATGAILPSAIPGLSGIALDSSRLGKLAMVGPRQVYRVEATGTIIRPGNKRVQVRIVAVFDTMHINQNTTSGDLNDRQGTWVYWRME